MHHFCQWRQEIKLWSLLSSPPSSGAQSRSSLPFLKLSSRTQRAGGIQPKEQLCLLLLWLLPQMFFSSALADGFQTEGTLGNETEKAVTHCARCQGMAVTHGSWWGPWHAPRHGTPAGPKLLSVAAFQPQRGLLHAHQQLGHQQLRAITCCCSAPPADVPRPRVMSRGLWQGLRHLQKPSPWKPRK